MTDQKLDLHLNMEHKSLHKAYFWIFGLKLWNQNIHYYKSTFKAVLYTAKFLWSKQL